MRRAAREIRSAVDRVDDPCRRARRAGDAGALLANEPVAGEDINQPRLDQPLHFAVDLGDEVLRPLEADREGAGVEEPAPRHRARLARHGASGEKSALQRGRVDRQACLPAGMAVARND